MKRSSPLIYILIVASIVFFGISTWFISNEKYLQSLLALAIGLILLSSALSIARESSLEYFRK